MTVSENSINKTSNLGQSSQKYLVAPFEDEQPYYVCQCPSCEAATRYRYLIPRVFVCGFVFPLIWLCNLIIYTYTQWFLEYEPAHPQIQPDSLPTAFEIELNIKRTHLNVTRETFEDIERVNEVTTIFEDNKGLQGSECSLQCHRNQFLRQVASEILDSHERKRAYYKRWTLGTLLAMLTYMVIIALIIIACQPGYKKWHSNLSKLIQIRTESRRGPTASKRI